jgi:hypothetical protein
VPVRASVARCRVAAWASCRIAAADLPQLRQQPPIFLGSTLPAAFLKHADEQTVVGLTAVARAIQDFELENTDFSHWGVIAAPRFLGRAALAVALTRYAAEGAWGISPHLIPHRSLHALSGTVSQALKIHGPNYGVGGGADGAAEALMTAGALLASEELPGLWTVLTGFDPELIPGDPNQAEATPSESDGIAVALALVPPGHGHAGPLLSVGAGAAKLANLPEFSLEELARAINHGESFSRWKLRCGGWASWDDTATAAEICV